MNVAKRDSTVADHALVYAVLGGSARASPHSQRALRGIYPAKETSQAQLAPSRRPSCLVVFAWGFSSVPPPRKGPVMALNVACCETAIRLKSGAERTCLARAQSVADPQRTFPKIFILSISADCYAQPHLNCVLQEVFQFLEEPGQARVLFQQNMIFAR
jgi:hypothetical protein